MAEEHYQHAEAFCLMSYRADDDKADVEQIWNSRDGVTPFVITNRNGRTATHVAWESDRPQPDYRPKVGDRIFVPLTQERAEQIAGQQSAHWWSTQDEMGRYAREVYDSQEQLYAVLVEGLTQEVHRGVPDLVEVTAEMAEQHGWTQEEQTQEAQVDRITDKLMEMGLRDPHGYRLPRPKIRGIAVWVLAQDPSMRREQWVDSFLVEMLVGPHENLLSYLPMIGSGYDTPAEDDLVWEIIQVALSVRSTSEGDR